MDESPLVGAPNADVSPPSHTVVGTMTTEELVAKAIAPVKREYLRPHTIRTSIVTSDAVNDDVSEQKSAPVNSLLKEKKSKRQFKRDRIQEQKSALHICPQVAKTGNVDSCIYKDSCRFSHDVEAFKEQKPADLEGDCPFLTTEGSCPYGLACRYLGTHESDVSNGSLKGVKKGSEANGLSKEVQKLLWKNKMEFPKADAKLKALGLLEKAYSKKKKVDEEKVVSNEPLVNDEKDYEVVSDSANNKNNNEIIDKPSLKGPETKVSLGKTLIIDEQGPLKKSKPVIDENCSNGGEVEDMAVDETVTEDAIMETDASLKFHPREKKLIDFRDKLYLAPLTTVGNLPFRRVCKMLGADITCGEMAMCTNLLQGQASEWALLRRHSSEDLFGVQICGAFPDNVARVVELIDQECSVDFIDINMGCPIDLVVNKGGGSALLLKPLRMKNIIKSASEIVEKPITVKVRTGYLEGRNRVDSLIEDIGRWGASALTIHGRSRQQRYTKLADWDYINQCVKKSPEALQVIGNGDVFSYVDWNKHKSDSPELSTCMIARGALVKPWIFTEIKEQRHWDISSGERLNILRDYVRCGLQHWGSDSKGVETTRHFLLEWLSYTYRYVPVALLDVVPPQLNWRPPFYVGRDDLETLMASESAADWVRISEMLLGKVPASFKFAPKHKSNAYDKAENG